MRVCMAMAMMKMLVLIHVNSFVFFISYKEKFKNIIFEDVAIVLIRFIFTMLYSNQNYFTFRFF